MKNKINQMLAIDSNAAGKRFSLVCSDDVVTLIDGKENVYKNIFFRNGGNAEDFVGEIADLLINRGISLDNIYTV